MFKHMLFTDVIVKRSAILEFKSFSKSAAFLNRQNKQQGSNHLQFFNEDVSASNKFLNGTNIS